MNKTLEESMVAAVRTEMMRGVAKYGPYNSLHEAYAVILEELDELWNEIKNHKPDFDRVESEAIQVAATAMRLAIEVAERSFRGN